MLIIFGTNNISEIQSCGRKMTCDIL